VVQLNILIAIVSDSYDAAMAKSEALYYRANFELVTETAWAETCFPNWLLPTAKFNGVNTYPDSIVMCVLLTPLTIWLRHGRDLVENGPTLRESQKPEFTNTLCYQENKEGGILLNNLEERLMKMFHDEAYAYKPEPMITFDLQLDTPHFIYEFSKLGNWWGEEASGEEQRSGERRKTH